jgi:hypothetical protein
MHWRGGYRSHQTGTALQAPRDHLAIWCRGCTAGASGANWHPRLFTHRLKLNTTKTQKLPIAFAYWDLALPPWPRLRRTVRTPARAARKAPTTAASRTAAAAAQTSRPAQRHQGREAAGSDRSVPGGSASANSTQSAETGNGGGGWYCGWGVVLQAGWHCLQLRSHGTRLRSQPHQHASAAQPHLQPAPPGRAGGPAALR